MSTSLPRMNKANAGFHMLMIISAVDNKFPAEEDLIISDYIAQEYPFRLNMDREVHLLSSLRVEERKSHFIQCMNDFEIDATEEEKKNFIQFAINLTKADKVITRDENSYLNLLFKNWYPE